MKKILLVTTMFEGGGRGAWLLDDLAAEFARAGNQVDVVVADAQYPRPRGWTETTEKGARVLSVGPDHGAGGTFGKLLRYLQVGIGLHGLGFRETGSDYDIAIYTSIAAFSWGFPSRMRRLGRVKQLTLVYWDFFPIHQYEIGRMRVRAIRPIAKWAERAAMKRADRIAVMSPANSRFLKEYFPGLSAELDIVPPWSSSSEVVPDPNKWGGSVLEAVFGGQLAKGRGLETLIAAASILEAKNERQIRIRIAGSGSEEVRLRSLAAGLSNVQFLGQLSRDDYRSMLAAAHLGIAITVPGVSPPTFPSKIGEYAGAEVPVLVAVEQSSDAGELVERYEAGYTVSAGDAEALAEVLRLSREEFISGELQQKAFNTRSLWEQELSVRRAADRLLSDQ